ncbi:hypothetical protein CLV62_12038 [Dysgonomonas alginatilytica]|uniref:Uncharacterized protein n=1 Tax=Dysgonomonas alginatilytica TaxID=1605892 RepID=A0A2V3PL57_9BACT|nr:hypothetical protein [Dysgonomonas alginatilytica]PXV62350.1 hypothetical protein CLV62_12038 [Dysgonomonas alginatilytica]
MEITDYTSCSCGAITVYFKNGENNSLKRSNKKRFNISLRGVKKLNDTYCCDHCVNHYGLDICECGSGKTPEKCCNKGTREQLGKSVKLFDEMKFNPEVIQYLKSLTD